MQISFRQRHGFVASFALESARGLLMRRLELIRQPKLDIARFIVCLPLTSPDPFGRPIVIAKPRELQHTSSLDDQCLLCTCMEALRVRLQQLNFNRDVKEPPVLQYIFLLDMEGMSLSSAVRPYDPVGPSSSLIISQRWMEVLSTFKRHVLPIFPGMIAAGACLFSVSGYRRLQCFAV